MTPVHLSNRTFDNAAAEAAAWQTTAQMEALVAAYALVAHADGEVAGAERRRIFAILRDNPAMSVFSHDEITEEIAAHEANYRYDPEVAQQIACEKLVPIRGSRRAAAQVIAACRALIPADGVAHPAEYRALAQIKALLEFDDVGLDAARGARNPAAQERR